MSLFGGAKIKIDRELHRELSLAAEDRGYSSVDEMAEHVLREALKSAEPALNEQDRRLAEEQLRGLGYLK